MNLREYSQRLERISPNEDLPGMVLIIVVGSLSLASIPILNPADLSVTGDTVPHAASLWDGCKD